VTISALIKALSEAGEVQRAMSALHDMRRGGLPPDTVVYNSVLHGCAKAGERDIAIALLHEMNECDVALDEVTYSTVLHACAMSGDVPAAMGIFHRMQAVGIQPNETSYGSLLHACAMGGNALQAQAVFDSLISTGVYVGEVPYTSLVHAYATARDPDHALLALRQMAESGVPPNAKAFNAAINACARAKPCTPQRLQEALDLAEEMHSLGCRLDHFTFTALLKVCTANKNAKAADKVFQKMMPEHHVLPNAFVYRAYAACLRRCGLKERLAEVKSWQRTDTDAPARGRRQGASHAKKETRAKMPMRARMCRFFLSPQGCRNGESCPFMHDAPDDEVWAMISGYAGP